MDLVRKTLLLIPAAVFDHQRGLVAVYSADEPYPYARPAFLRYTFVLLRLMSTLLLLPVSALLLALRIKPKPRPSWSIAQCLLVEFNRRASGASDLAGVRWGERDPRAEPKRGSLSETRFEWMATLPRVKRVGMIADPSTHPSDAVGCYIWEQDATDLATEDGADEKGLIGIYAHGGSYLHQSAHESSMTSAIPRRLIKTNTFHSVYSVEYRLLPSPFPAALQDVASVYCALLDEGVEHRRIVLVGDSTGGNIVLALARWIRDERAVPPPAGMLLLSPWCDPSSSFPTSFEFYDPRPHPEDYLSDHPQARLDIVRSILGPHRDHHALRHPYISPAVSPIAQDSFRDFPPTFIHYGDAERLEEEIDRLVRAMKRDGVPLSVMKTRDAVHDILILPLWDKKFKQQIWSRIEEWLEELETSATAEAGK